VTVSRAFRRAEAYSQASRLQQMIGRDLLTWASGSPTRVLDLGSGTGETTQRLVDNFPGISLTLLDSNVERLAVARAKRALASATFVSADFFEWEDGQKFDMIFSNSACHWMHPISDLFGTISRYLVSGGTFLASFFGPATFFEAKMAWRHAFGETLATPADRFSDLDTLLAEFHAFELKRVGSRYVGMEFRSVYAFLKWIRETGTGGEKMFLTRGQIASWESSWRRLYGRVSATAEVFFVQVQWH